ncbi:MAG: hypothetical protein WAK82_39765 [Streptosporangiaceae bacterium]
MTKVQPTAGWAPVRVAVIALVVVMVALLAFVVVSGAATSSLAPGQVWAALSLLTIVVIMAVVGLVVASHQPRNPIGWLLAGEAVFVLASVAGGACASMVYRLGHHDLAFAGPLALILNQLFSFLLAGFPLVILLFPDGRLPSRSWRWAVGIYLAITGAAVLATCAGVLILVAGRHVDLQASGNLASFGQWGTAWVAPVAMVFIFTAGVFWLAAIGRQALSWRRSADERRQQLKWLASGAAVCGVFGIWAITTDSAIWEVLILGFAALPVSIGIGIMKYRLYDIDRIISRTLAYAIVTGLLIGLYAGLVLLATRVLTFHGPVAVAVSTLAAAALFNPLRRWVQRRVDRRFNRARYNAEQTVAAFAARLQDTVELGSVRGELAQVVSQALEPAHVSVWLNDRG